MAKRKPISKKTRFEVFKRDGFKCVYCGSTPPNISLELDHYLPVCDGGDNDIDNLVTSCFNCNRGKSSNNIEVPTSTMAQRIAMMKEAEEQFKELNKLKAVKRRRKNKDIQRIENSFSSIFDDKKFSDSFRVSISRFLDHFEVEELLQFIDIAASRINDPERCTKYFCGICWKTIKERQNA